MNKDEFNLEFKEDNNHITISLIKSALENIEKQNTKKTATNNNKNYDSNSNKIFQDTKNVLNYIKVIDNIFYYISKPNMKLYRLLKRNNNYTFKLASKSSNSIFKKIKDNYIEPIIALFIKLLSLYINEKSHKNIKRLLVLIIRLIIDEIIPVNSLEFIIEIFVNIFIIIVNENQDSNYSLNDEPFLFINDIIDSLLFFSKNIKEKNLDNSIIIHIIDIFDKYLITPTYINISFRGSPIWLKFLEKNMISPPAEKDKKTDVKFIEDETNTDYSDSNNIINNDKKEENLQKKIYIFLIKIYKYDMKDEYFQNSIIPKGIVNLNYYTNSMNYLMELFKKEKEELNIDSSFKILNGFNLQKDTFLFLSNIRLKLNDFSIIFSFKINQVPKDIEEISILNLYYKSVKSTLYIFLDKNNYLNIIFNGEKKWNTFIKIKENIFYLVCLSQTKKIIGNVYKLFINEKINEKEIKTLKEYRDLMETKEIKDDTIKNREVQETDCCYYYKKKYNGLDLSKEMNLELGKNNFIGIIGEFLIINKNLKRKNIHHLFNLKGNYSKVLSQIYNKYEILFPFDSFNKNKSKFGINKSNDGEKNAIAFFKKLEYDIKLEIMSYKINRFSKLKYVSQNYENEQANNTIKPVKENNERNVRLMSIVSIRSGTNSLNSSGVVSISNSSFNNSYVYQKECFKQDTINVNLSLFKYKYSCEVFYYNQGIDFLTLQLHNIISTVDDKKLLDKYLYDTIVYISSILSVNDNIIDSTVRNSPKLDNKVSIFFLTLLNILNKKNNITLSDNVISKLIEILELFRFIGLFHQRNIILSILLEVKYYEKPVDIFKYTKLFKGISSDLSNQSNGMSLINPEFLYKILMLDFIFELKEYKHKFLTEIITAFLTFKKHKGKQNEDIDDTIISEFINYFVGLKSEIKIYHYLKIIYINSNKIKTKLLNEKNLKFLEYINMNVQKFNCLHCKYCTYNQILCYLINEEICINPSSENDHCFHYNPNGFMKNPSIFFIKTIFVQCFKIQNDKKLKLIKSKSEGIQFILAIKNIIKKEEQKRDSEYILLQLVGYNKFIPSFTAIVDYIKFLIPEQRESKDTKLLKNIQEMFNIIISFLKEVCLERKKYVLIFSNRGKKWSIVNNDNDNDNINNESEKRPKENNRLIKQYIYFIQELFCCKGMKEFYDMYLNINYKQATEDIKDFIHISISYTFNPFYYNLLLIDSNYENDLNDVLSDDDEPKKPNNINNNNQSIIIQLLNLMTTELMKKRISFDDSQNYIIVQNNILLLLHIHQIIINSKNEINEEIEKTVILFLNYLLDNFFYCSKYVFDLSIIAKSELKVKSNKKFIIEMIADILFTLYETKSYDLKYQYLIKVLFSNKNCDLKKIDEQYFLEQKKKVDYFKYYNQDFLQNICKGVEVPEILYNLYFLYYLCEKYNKYKNNNNYVLDKTDNTIENTTTTNTTITTSNNDNNNVINSQPLKLVKEIMNTLYLNVFDLYRNYFQKILYVRKHLINKYPYKIYKGFMQFIEVKYKEKNYPLDKLIKYYDKLIAKKDINSERTTYFSNEEFVKKSSLDINMSLNSKNTNSSILETNTWKQSFRKKKIDKKNSFLSEIEENITENNPEAITQKKENDKIYNPNKKRPNSASNIHKKKPLIINKLQKLKTLKPIISKEIRFDDSDSESNDNNNSQEDSDKDNVSNKNNINLKNDNDNNMFRKEQSCKEFYKLMLEENKEEDNKNNLPEINDVKENDLSLEKSKNIDDEQKSDISEEENDDKEYDIRQKLENINISSKLYRNLFHLSNADTMKILFNPKEYYFWNKFTLILKDILFNDKKFGILTKIYNITYKQNKTKKYKCKLKYPTKLKNFICDDYYRPFIKPDLNFFKNKLLPKTHSYLKTDLINKNISDDDNLKKIHFKRILPINYDLKPTKKIVCELINNKGSVYGHIYFNHAFLLFISDNNNDPRCEKIKNNNFNEEQEEFYLYSYFLQERLKSKKKYVIMYYYEIKEIFIRRFCLNYVGYEIFMKDNRSHLFNFFNKNNLKKFLQIMSEKLEAYYIVKNNPNNANNLMMYSNNDNILSLQTLNFNINNDINFCVINDPLNIFEKNGYKMKYQKGEISNFKYLLLVNKYSSRTYNDNSQYLVFPLLIMNSSKKLRDLSKAICLNKENKEHNESIFRENFMIVGSHFNTHYSTSGYILYYLVRLNPFTLGHIKFQSGHFDTPERIFSSLNNYLTALSTSNENRELCPELFNIYDAFINLNHNNIGYIKNEKKYINDFDTNDESGIFEFIVNMRQLLEKSNIIPWIDNIFGCNQINKSEDLINIFPLSSYEQFNNFEEKKKKLEKKGTNKKDIINQIKENICLLGLGISPIQLFKVNHPMKLNMLSKRTYSYFQSGIITNNLDRISNVSHKEFYNFIHSNMINKYQIFCLSNENNNYGMKLLIKSNNNINIFKMYNFDNSNKNNSVIKLELWKRKQIKIDPLSKICCELSPGIFCFCRFIDNVIQIQSKTEKKGIQYQYKCIITSLEFFSHNEIKNNTNNTSIHTNEIIFGDELGYLNLLQIEYEINNKKQEFHINHEKTRIIKENKAHNSFIQGILYVKRLNIIISYSEEGQITVNNAYSFNIINIIELGEKYFIKNIKLSVYDLMYVYCNNNDNKYEYIKCYTLNGVKATQLKTKNTINNYFINDKLIVVYENNFFEFYNLYDLSKTIREIKPYFKNNDNKIENENEKKIVFSDFVKKESSLIIIYQDHDIFAQDISSDESNKYI